MKAEELMIGDWVSIGKPCKVIGIDKMEGKGQREGYTFKLMEGEGITLLMFHAISVEPIPLTPEILKKNGFGYIEKDDWVTHFYPGEPQFCKDMNLHIGTDGKGNYWLNAFSNTIYGLKFLHELQHALKICRIDKTIEL